MKLYFKKFHFSMFAVALLCVALGVALLLWPEQSQSFFCYAFGALLTISGIFQIASYLISGEKSLLHKLMFVGGVIAVVAGVWILFSPGKVLTLAVIVLGVVLLYHGVMDIKYAFDLKRCQHRAWGAALICGLITCGVGVLMLVNPFESMELLFFVVAIGFIFDGITDLFTVVVVAQGERRLALAEQRAQAIEGKGSFVDELATPTAPATPAEPAAPPEPAAPAEPTTPAEGEKP